MKKLFLSVLMLLLTFVAISLVPVRAETPIGTTFDFSIETKIGNNEAIVTNLGNKTYGSTVTIDAGSYNPSNEFVTYIVNNKVEPNIPANNTFIVTSDLDITAIYKPVDTIAVSFMDANQDLLSVQFIASGANATAPNISGLVKPGMQVSATTPWSGSYLSVTEDIVLWVVYEPVITEALTLTVNNGTGSGSYDYNEVATVTASGSSTFQYWSLNGNIVSLQSTYSFTVLADTEITAVYTGEATGENPESLFISLSDSYALQTSYSTYVGQFYLPTGHEMVEFGLIASNTPGDITLNTAGVEKIRSNKFYADTGEFVRSLLDSSYASKNIRAYMITTNGELLTTTYSFVNDNLYISEYGEGNSNNKWIEIYNPNNYDVNLSDYQLLLFSNGAATGGSSPDFNGVTISAKNVLVIYNSGSVSAVIEEGDISSTVTYFNGDDAVALYKNGYILDQFGVIGTDPGTSWAVGSGDTVDNTLVRKSSISSPNPTWDATEWDVYPIDTFTYIGNHNPTAPTTITITGATTVMAGATINLSVTYPANTIKGVNWSITSGTAASVNSSGVVTGVSEGTVTVTATSTADTNITDTHIVEVTAPITYTVTYMSDETQFDQQTPILSGSTTTAPEPAPEKSGFTFDGWFLSDDGGTTLGEEWVFESDTVNANTTLYAKWIESGSLEDYTYVLTISSSDISVPTGSSYVAVTDSDASNGTWSGMANKTTVDGKVGFGQKALNYLTYTAATGYYVYSVSVSFNSGGATLRSVSANGQVLASGTGTNTVYTSVAPVVLTGSPTTFTFAVNTGTNNIISVTVVCKPISG
jgi:uncharacterized repeat protein (TIGR02543 family)